MKRISGSTFAFIGLLVGISVGLGINLFKEYLINEIVEALEDEVKASCDCSLAFDSFTVSFITLSGRASNVRILEKGTPKLTFNKVTANFSLGQIREKIISIDNLVLSSGQADGVGPESATFRFIDQLTTPAPPEKADPNRWRAVLEHLEVRDARFREPLGEKSELTATGVALQVDREGENFRLEPTIKDIRYRTIIDPEIDDVSELPLGSAKASVVIEDLRTVFQSLALSRDTSSLSLQATVDTELDDALLGNATYSLNTSYLGLPDWLNGQLSGKPAVRGSLGSPILSGPVVNQSGTPLTLFLPNSQPLSFDSLQGELTVDVNHGDPVVTLENLSGTGGLSTIRSTRPLTYSDKGLDADFSVTVPSFTYGPFTVKNARAAVSVIPMGDDMQTKIAIDCSALHVEQTNLGPALIDLDLGPSELKTKVVSKDPRMGSFSWEGDIDISLAAPELRKGILSFDKYRQPLTAPVDPKKLSPVAITSTLTLSGPLDLASLRAEGPTTIAFPLLPNGMPLSGRTTLKDGALQVSLPDSTYGGSAHLKLDLGRSLNGELRAKLPPTSLSRLAENNECGQFDASLLYNFNLSNPFSGSGSLGIQNLFFGCDPYTLRFTRNASLPIVNGSLQFKDISITGVNSSLDLSGSLGFEKGFDIALGGEIFLSSFLPFMSAIDDLRGKLDTRLTIKGPLGAPLFGGRAKLMRGEFGLASPEVEVHDAEGSFLFTGNSIRIETLTGTINNGTFDIRGSVLPFDLPASSISTRLKEVTIEPIEDSVITFSGDLALGALGKARQTLSGKINIDFAEIEKNFDINQILVRTLTGYFIPSRIQPRANTNPINLDLDVSIEAPRNIFVFTPFFTAELNASIQAQGTVAEPHLSGGMSVLSGWVGLKDNRFDITNGALTFRPGSLAPRLELASEGTLRTSTGESILVMLEASGPLQNPRISLSSDRGLSHDELLVLLTSSRTFGSQTLANRAGAQFARDQRFLLSEDTFSSIGAFFRSLTRIETLSLEPIYNPFTGSIEPALVGKKNLTSRLSLVGNSTFSTLPNSRAGVVYNLTSSVNLLGFFQSMPARRQAALSADLAYTILSEQSRFVDLQVEGPSAFERESILASARLGLASRVRNTSEALESIHRGLVQYMNQQGFLSARATVECLEGEQYCSRLRIVVDEGPKFTIGGVVFKGHPLPIPAQDIVRRVVKTGSGATSSTLDEVERRLIIALRNEGYISARVSPKYEVSDDAGTVDLVVEGDSRQPISFVFAGNTVFSASEFLDSIQLFSRKRPFGNNTINLLVQNIERMYQERGYLFARVSFREDRSNPSRLTYEITIVEEDSIPVRTLELRGNSHLGRGRIKQVMKELGFAEEVDLLKPDYAIPDQLDALREILVSVYNQEGYPDAEVRYEIVPTKNGSALDITFAIKEGEPHTVDSISVSGFPADVQPPTKPETPTSLPRTNRFIQQLVDTLSSEGFFYPAITADLDPRTGMLEIVAEPGTRTTISGVRYEGLSKVKESVAIDYTILKTGAPYRSNDVNQTKHKLLRSGLFSRVEVLPADGAFDSDHEAVVIRLSERPLQTLEVGGGANSELGVHVFGEAVDKSLFADGKSLALRLDSFFDDTELGSSQSITQGFASLRYMDPSFLGSDYTLTEDLRYQRQDLPTQEWNLDRVSLASYALRQIGSGISLSAGHTFLVDDLYDVTPGAIISDLDEGTVRLSFLSALLSIDRRDDPLLPRSGYTFTIEPKLSTHAFGSEATYALINANASGTVPLDALSRRFSLGLRLLGGFAEPFGPTEEIPITQRFYLGGRTTVRGFRQNELGPRGSDGAVIGGDTLFGGNSQLQYLLTDTITTHVFFDFGNVFLREQSFALADLRTSTGVGFRYLSPIGPIGFDVGAPLDEKPGEPSIRVHFSVGSAF
jgi:outer membrane protein insertion porin family